MPDPNAKNRTIRSFVRRTGRMTPSQQRAMRTEWPKYGIAFSPERLDMSAIFGRDADKTLEIGFGNGDTLVMAAAENPRADFLGIEVHEPGVGHCLLKASALGLTNLRVIAHDAMEVLSEQLADASLARINLYFADPWPKKRHHKRRIVNQPFLDLAAQKLRRDGALHIATDWKNYAEHIDEVMAGRPDFNLRERREHAGNQPLDRHTTKFEARGIKRGHRIWDWQFQRR